MRLYLKRGRDGAQYDSLVALTFILCKRLDSGQAVRSTEELSAFFDDLSKGMTISPI